MQVGDLITLSSVATSSVALRREAPRMRKVFKNKPPLMGIVLKIRTTRPEQYNEYIIKWLNDPAGPTGRYGNHSLIDYFWRKDLKFVRKQNG